MNPSPSQPEAHAGRAPWVAALAAAPTVGLTATWLWILVLWMSRSQDETAWRYALICLLAFAVWGALVFVAGWLAAARAIGLSPAPRWLGRLGLALGVASVAALLTGQIGPH